MKKTIIAIVMLLLATGLLKVGYELGKPKEVTRDFTGQEFFDGVNRYRASKGLPQLELYAPLCNGLFERWQVLKEPETFGHQGLEDWLNKVDPQVTLYVKEVSSAGSREDSVEVVINDLLGSPGHRLALEDPEANLGCSYAEQGAVVLEIARKRL